jgi:hypothetical protein
MRGPEARLTRCGARPSVLLQWCCRGGLAVGTSAWVRACRGERGVRGDNEWVKVGSFAKGSRRPGVDAIGGEAM